MANTIARFEGTEKMAANLKEIERRVVNKGLKEAFMEAAELVRVEAGNRAPRRTGRLSRSMVAEWQGRKRRAVVGPNKDAYYGSFVEFGTSKTAAHPFLRPALDSKRDQVFAIIGSKLKDVLEEPL